MPRTVRAVFLVGPTASGKTGLAVDVAERMDAEIVSCDSRQLYRGMSIGTAAPTTDDQRRVRHHLVGMADPRERWTAGRFADAAFERISAIAESGRAVILVGGSGLYVRAIRHGLAELPHDADVRAELLETLRSEGAEALHTALLGIDPDSAASIHPRNGERLVRALELARLGGPLRDQWRRQNPDPPPLLAPILAIGRPRERLVERIDRRVPDMLDAGWIPETEALLAAGFDDGWPSYRTLGYPEVVEHLRRGIPLATTASDIAAKTRRFAKRQDTWFRHQPDVEWLREDDEAGWIDIVSAHLARQTAFHAAVGPEPRG